MPCPKKVLVGGGLFCGSVWLSREVASLLGPESI